MQIEIQGHTDNIGKNERNLLMSKNRAEAVYNYIASQGIDKSRLVAKGYGKEIPILPNTNDANRSKNRRVEFLILKNDK
jgi:outer membrane protein OmpA-like peptidoglycan-associated protein